MTGPKACHRCGGYTTRELSIDADPVSDMKCIICGRRNPTVTLPLLDSTTQRGKWRRANRRKEEIAG